MAVIGTVTCPNCGNPNASHYKHASQKQAQWYCTKETGGCSLQGSFSLTTGEPLPRGKPDPRPCSECEQIWQPSNYNAARNPKCPNCRRPHHRSYTNIIIGQCAWCEEWFTRRRTANDRGKYCNRQCAKQASRQQRRQRRRDIGRSTFRPTRDRAIALAYQYGYKCQICRKLIDLSVKPPHPNSLALDHIEPQTDGGSHDTINLRPTHKKCNDARQHTGEAQTQLFGAH